MYRTVIYTTDFLINIFEYFYSSFKHFIKFTSKIKNKLYNCNVNQDTNNNTNVMKEMLMGKSGRTENLDLHNLFAS